MKKIISTIILLAFSTLPIYPLDDKDSTNTSEDVKTVIPDANYQAGWFHKIFFGAHWRDLWSTPLQVKVLDLNTFAGGLKPFKKEADYRQNL